MEVKKINDDKFMASATSLNTNNGKRLRVSAFGKTEDEAIENLKERLKGE